MIRIVNASAAKVSYTSPPSSHSGQAWNSNFGAFTDFTLNHNLGVLPRKVTVYDVDLNNAVVTPFRQCRQDGWHSGSSPNNLVNIGYLWMSNSETSTTIRVYHRFTTHEHNTTVAHDLVFYLEA